MNTDVRPSDESPASRAVRAVDGIVLTAIVAAALALRCWRLNERGLWFDEAFSWRLTTFGWREMLHRATLDNNPPLYYVVLKLWTACFGTGAAAMRSLSVLAGTAACLAGYLFVSEAYSTGNARQSLPPKQLRSAALLAAALTAVSVLQIRWSWEVRMYSLGSLLAALSSWLLVRALHRQSLAPWLLYAAAALAFAYTHTFALFSVAAQSVYAAGYLLLAPHDRIGGASAATARCVGPRGVPAPRDRWRVARHYAGPCLAAVVVAGGYAPWLGVLLRQHEQVRASFWTEPCTWACVAKAANQMFIDPLEIAAADGKGWACAGMTAAVLVGLAFRPLPADCFLCLSAVVPTAAAALISAYDIPIFEGRYLAFAQLFVLCALARLASDVPRRLERAVIAAVLVAGFLVVMFDFTSRLPQAGSSGLRQAAEHVLAHGQPNDVAIVCSPYFFLPMLHELDQARDCRLLSSRTPILHYEGAAALTAQDLISPREASAVQSNRVWVLEGGTDAAAVLLPQRRWRRASVSTFFEEYGIGGPLRLIEYELLEHQESAAPAIAVPRR